MSNKKITVGLVAVIALMSLCGFCAFVFGLSTTPKYTYFPQNSSYIYQTPISSSVEQNNPPPAPLEQKPTCTQDQEKSRTCSACNKADVTFLNADCSTSIKTVDDSNCSSLCPPPPPAPEPPPPPSAPAPQSSGFICDCSKTCSQISSCAEAYFQLNQCGCSKRDGDHDGIPCENLCQ